MRKATAELILKDPDRFAHHDRVFLNNPVVMQGMGLAPLVVLATTAHNGVMLAAAVTLLLVPSRVLACLLSRLFPLNSENPAPEELQKKLLPRALVYSLSASVVYLAAYPILNAMFGTSLLTLGIYLPLLRFAVSATGGAHLCSIQYYLRFWLSSCRTSLAVSVLRIMRYCLKSCLCLRNIRHFFVFRYTLVWAPDG